MSEIQIQKVLESENFKVRGVLFSVFEFRIYYSDFPDSVFQTPGISRLIKTPTWRSYSSR